jgi:DNA-binding MarR family transcriptional regulator
MAYSEMGDLRREIYQLIGELFIELESTDRQLMNQFNLNVTQYWALVYLENPEGLPLSELAFLLMRDKSNMTGLVDKLEKERLAVRKPGKNGDRRFTRVVLTEHGNRLRSQVILSHNDLINSRLEGFPEKRLRELHVLLHELSHELQSQLENGKTPGLIKDVVE